MPFSKQNLADKLEGARTNVTLCSAQPGKLLVLKRPQDELGIEGLSEGRSLWAVAVAHKGLPPPVGRKRRE